MAESRAGAAPQQAEREDPAAGNPLSDILSAEHWAQQILPHEDDEDITFSDNSSIGSTPSLSASILEYRTINGRTYHSNRTDAQYWGPNDEAQNNSMDINHHLLTLALDGELFLAPIGEKVQSVLDIGTGTGLWAIDFADEHPDTQVIGTDISPIQPTWLPPNLRFEIDDATLDWTFQPDSFDFIHMRYLFGSIANWQDLFDQAFRCCKPGGYLESFEMSSVACCDDDSVPDGSALAQWSKVFVEGGKKFGRSFTVVDDDVQQTCMKAAGFTDITVKDIKCPVGGWAKDPKSKEMGIYSQAALEADIEGYVLFMFNAVLGWSKEEIQVYTAHLRKQIRDPQVHAWFRMRLVYGRKPGNEE